MSQVVSEQRKFDYLVIEGPIGVGKTSLAKKLAQDFSAGLLLEEVDDNPFLQQFYHSSKQLALPTQLYFLLSRIEQLKDSQQKDIFASGRVGDYLLEKDRLFARLLLDDKQFELYQKIYQGLLIPDIKPDLVVYLQAPVDVLMERIRKRGRHFERLIREQYLHSISAAYTDFFYHYKDAPLLIINTGNIDFIDDKDAYAKLKERILVTTRGTNYYNPLVGDLA